MELRGKLTNLENAKIFLQQLNATLINEYAFTDYLYFLSSINSLEEGYIRIRTPSSEQTDQRIQVMEKVRHHGQMVEGYRSYFSDLETAQKMFHDHQLACVITRKGWKYQLPYGFAYVEDIENYGVSMEIECENKDENQARQFLNQMQAMKITEHAQKSFPMIFWESQLKNQNPN